MDEVVEKIVAYTTSSISEFSLSDQYFILEEVCNGSGISSEIAQLLQDRGNYHVHVTDLGKDFVPHGDTASLYRLTGIDGQSISNYVREVLKHEN